MAKRTLIFTSVLLVVAVFLLYGNSPGLKRGFGTTVHVQRIYDGDTLAAYIGGRFEKIRLIGIDAPELDQRPWGKIAEECLASFLTASHSMISLEHDAEQRDKYGRVLAYLWSEDGKLLNEEILKKGCAVLFTVPPNVKYSERFRAAQKKAREQKTGIWGEHGLQERPYNYRKEHPRKSPIN